MVVEILFMNNFESPGRGNGLPPLPGLKTPEMNHNEITHS